MACVLLALAGPAQSWGTTSRFTVRDSGTEPSKSGVVGLCAAALGRKRDEPIDDLASLRMGVRVDTEGLLQRDYHTAQGAIKADGSSNKEAVESRRYFLADAAFLVALEGDQELIGRLDRALRQPHWPLFLGRKAFPPAGPVARGIDQRSLEDVLAVAPWTGPSPKRAKYLRDQLKSGQEVRLRTVVEVPATEATEFRDDQPIAFMPPSYSRRPTRTSYIPLTYEILGDRDVSGGT